jgi:hypothetical protein
MRTLFGLVLIVAVVGCGGGDKPAPAEPKTPLTTETTPQTQTQQPAAPKDDPKTPSKEQPKTPPAPAAAWEPDPAKQTIPAAPAAGSLGKAAFAPQQAEFETDTLTFRAVDKDGQPTRMLTVKLPDELVKSAAGGVKLVVKPEEPVGPKLPVVTTEVPGDKGGPARVVEYKNGFGLTLDLGKRDRGALPGKVFISLPGDDKDFLAGTFTADWVRPPSEPPGADDVPFVQGAVTVAGAKADTQVSVGYIGVPKGTDVAQDVLQMAFAAKGLSARSDHTKPRVTVFVAADAPDKAGRYEHTRLPAGKYLVFAGVKDGPAAGKWVALPADGKLTLDFALDPAKAGKLEVKAPADAKGKVLLVPADDAPVPLEVFGLAASTLGLQADVRDGVARFDRVLPGRYEARLNDLTGTVEVKTNETAKLELTPPKK